MRTNIPQQIKRFVDDGKLVMGICNGFQAMVKYPLLPHFAGEQSVTLTFNDSARFEDRWVYLRVNKRSPCIFTQGLESMYLPIRHAEGKFVVKNNDMLDFLLEKNQIALQYASKNNDVAGGEFPLNPNGSIMDIAALCDETGRIFGMMPHPEACLDRVNHPRWTREDVPKEGIGVEIFRNAVQYARRRL
jgi:phosphoribosylformylglycinamidine synthase